MEPLVSILIPAFNAAIHLSDAIASASAQTWRRKEIIVVDDGSTDGTRAVADRFSSRSIKIVSQAHQGASAARNHALSLSQGDYIQWLDADDLLGPGKIERQIAALEAQSDPDVVASCAWGHFFTRPSRAQLRPTSLWGDLAPVEWLVRKMEENVFMQTGVWLVSRRLTEAAGNWDPRLSVDDDGEYFCRVLLQSRRVCFVPEATVYYRRSGLRSLSFIGRSSEKMESKFHAMRAHIAHVRAVEDSDRVRAACATYLRDSLLAFHPERPDLVEWARQIAASLDRPIEAPRLPPKYRWLASILGPRVAKSASLCLPQAREAVTRLYERVVWA
jgi:glycosyltransferase involved in cell wall biosynthesis